MNSFKQKKGSTALIWWNGGEPPFKQFGTPWNYGPQLHSSTHPFKFIPNEGWRRKGLWWILSGCYTSFVRSSKWWGWQTDNCVLHWQPQSVVLLWNIHNQIWSMPNQTTPLFSPRCWILSTIFTFVMWGASGGGVGPVGSIEKNPYCSPGLLLSLILASQG